MVGALTVAIWIAQGWNSEFLGGPGVYEIIPGFIASTIAVVLVSLATKEEDLGHYAVEGEAAVLSVVRVHQTSALGRARPSRCGLSAWEIPSERSIFSIPTNFPVRRFGRPGAPDLRSREAGYGETTCR